MRDTSQRQPLLLAAASNSPQTVHELLGYGADATVSDQDGYTPLHLAAKSGRKSNGLNFEKKVSNFFIPFLSVMQSVLLVMCLSSLKVRLERHLTAKKTVFMITCEIFENFKNSIIWYE